jgi:hypothetical protein
MDEGTKATLVIVATIAIVVLINYVIIKSTTKGGRQANFLSKTLDTAKNPWKRENDQLDELARLVEKVSAKSPDESSSDQTDQGQ